MPNVLTPGSIQSRNQGCTCSVLDNHHGFGDVRDGNVRWYVHDECPLHGHGKWLKSLEEK